MVAVGVRELKNRLSEYLRLVRAGEIVLVTDRGEVVAELREPGNRGERTDLPPGLVELAKQGRATLAEPRPQDVDLYPQLPRLLDQDTLRQALDWVRGGE